MILSCFTALTFNLSRLSRLSRLSTPAFAGSSHFGHPCAEPGVALSLRERYSEPFRPARTALQQTHFGQPLPSFWTPSELIIFLVFQLSQTLALPHFRTLELYLPILDTPHLILGSVKSGMKEMKEDVDR